MKTILHILASMFILLPVYGVTYTFNGEKVIHLNDVEIGDSGKFVHYQTNGKNFYSNFTVIEIIDKETMVVSVAEHVKHVYVTGMNTSKYVDGTRFDVNDIEFKIVGSKKLYVGTLFHAVPTTKEDKDKADKAEQDHKELIKILTYVKSRAKSDKNLVKLIDRAIELSGESK